MATRTDTSEAMPMTQTRSQPRYTGGGGTNQCPSLSEDFSLEGVRIIHDDFLKTERIAEGSVDLVVTSPPYNVEVAYETFDDKISYAAYLDFSQQWLSKCYRLLKDDGRFCLNIPLDKNKGGQQSVYADLVTIAKKIGFQYHASIVWNEQNISRRTAWGSWLSASAPYIIAPVEMVAVLYKSQWKKQTKGQSDITRDEFIEWTNGVWSFMGESKRRRKHPSPFPEQLPRRCIKLFTYVGDTVLDPFLGSGTTLVACLQTEREGIGVEMDASYCALAKRRLIAEKEATWPRLV